MKFIHLLKQKIEKGRKNEKLFKKPIIEGVGVCHCILHKDFETNMSKN